MQNHANPDEVELLHHTACDVNIVTPPGSSLRLDINAQEVLDYISENHDFFSTESSIEWVLQHWPSSQQCKRAVTSKTLSTLKKAWQHYPAKLKNQYNQALLCILTYLHYELHWQVPDLEKKKLIDHDARIFEKITAYGDDAHRLIEHYEKALLDFYKNRHPLPPEWVALIIAMEVAPLPLDYLLQALHSPSSIETKRANTYLRLEHIHVKMDKDQRPPFSRYHLPLLAFRALQDHHNTSKNNKTLSIEVLESTLITLVETLKYPHEQPIASYCFDNKPNLNTPADLHLLLQAVWYFRDDVIPTFLKDISHPKRHVAFDKATVSPSEKKIALKTIYTQNWDEKIEKRENEKWPHHTLLKAFTNTGKKPERYTVEFWDEDNVLPQLLCLFVKNLILYGGQRKSKLANNTIKSYTALQPLLLPHPLPFSETQDHQALMDWAHQTYDGLTLPCAQQMMMRFFKFLSTQYLTDHIDLSALHSPTTQINVDANYISTDELHEIVHALLSDKKAHLFQRLFCAVAAILSYFAKLRRGEITRLRIKDIYCDKHNDQYFTLYVTNTSEGDTKNKHSRWVHLYLPEAFASLVRMCVKIKPYVSARDGKTNRSAQTPLIGFENERISSRQLHYLLPITRAIKAIVGANARFHHLRHSGAFVSLLQSLHMAYDMDETYLNLPVTLQERLSKDTLTQQFKHWLEGRSFLEMNDNFLFDDFTREIGHTHFETTRMHYIHGIEWLYPFYRQDGHSTSQRVYSRPELCYLLGLTKSSNDLSRHLEKMSLDYQKLSVNKRKSTQLHFSEKTIRNWLFLKQPDKAAVPTSQVPVLPPSYLTMLLNELLEGELRTGQPQNSIFPEIQKNILNSLFVRQFNHDKDNVIFSALSTLWHHSNKHKRQDVTQSWIRSLHVIDTMTRITVEDKAIIRIGMECNKKSAKHFRLAFKTSEWAFFHTTFHIKSDSKTKHQLIKNEFADANDDIIIEEKRRKENSAFYIDLSLKENLNLAELNLNHIFDFIEHFRH